MRIVLADDSAILREGVAGLLERRGHEVVATASDAPGLEAAVDALADELPDVVVTDVRMPPEMGDDGLRVAVVLRRRYPSLGVLVLSQYVAPAYARELFVRDQAAGGAGYLLKDRVADVADFLRTLETVADGGVAIDPDVAATLMSSGRSGLETLTPREREVLALMARGLSNGEIAGELYLSSAAVAKHVANVFAKLGLSPGEENRRVRAVLEYLTHTGGQL